jgi:hypothetical protein
MRMSLADFSMAVIPCFQSARCVAIASALSNHFACLDFASGEMPATGSCWKHRITPKQTAQSKLASTMGAGASRPPSSDKGWCKSLQNDQAGRIGK